MKKKHMVIIGILAVILSCAMVHAVFQMKQIKEIKEESGELQQEIEKLKDEVKTLQEEKEKAENKLQNIKAEEKKQESEAEPVIKEMGKKIAIDPGHQGPNVNMSDKEPLGPGSTEMKVKATGGTQGKFTGVPEYELNMDISRQLQTELEKRGYQVMLTRQDHETAISNKERAELATQWGADIYVRIHGNGSENSSVHGAMSMVPSKDNPFVSHLHEKSYALGEAVIQAYCDSCGMKNNGVQLFDNMTGINWSSVPVIILEMGFMTNETDDKNMQNAEYQERMVQGIANGIDHYFAAGN